MKPQFKPSSLCRQNAVSIDDEKAGSLQAKWDACRPSDLPFCEVLIHLSWGSADVDGLPAPRGDPAGES